MTPANSNHFDTLIVGGGVIGLTIAWRLAQRGACVVVIDRGEFGRESSWAGAGIIEVGSLARDDALARMRRESCRGFEEFAAELTAASGIDVEYDRCGVLDLVFDENQTVAAESEVAASRASGDPFFANIERITGKRLRAKEPALASNCRDALYIPHDAQVRNPALIRALLKACENAGVVLRPNHGAARLLLEDGRIAGVAIEDNIELRATYTIDCAGAWATQFDASLSEKMKVTPVRGQMVLIKAESGIFSHVVRNGSVYLVPRRDGHILVGATVEPRAGFDKTISAQIVKKFLRVAMRTIPALKQASFISAWAGLRPGTADGMPHLGPVPGLDGLVAACGHYRSGITLAPVTANMIADYIQTGTISEQLEAFLPTPKRRRPKRSPVMR
ncbi:MAG: glycine oxidase ThiO [Phycisphaerae bacterium]